MPPLQATLAVRAVATILAGLGLFCQVVRAEPGISLADLRQERLLSRFDQNRDGALDDTELKLLRQSFGGIDVPVLPDESIDYTVPTLTRALSSAQLTELDNTPADNRLTNPGALLGRILFHDRQLSQNNKISCASCHEQKYAFSDPRRFSVGFLGGKTGRNGMSLVNLRYSNLSGSRPGFFWDERAPTLEAQALMPIQDKIEMGMTLDGLAAKLQRLPYYPPLFQEAFGSDQVTPDRISKAIAQFMRSLESWNSKFDRARLSNNRVPNNQASSKTSDQLSPDESLGQSLFIDGLGGVAEFGCAHCHVPPTFGMAQSFNNGLDRVYADRGLGALARPTNDPFTVSNDGKFKAPSLRNVELTGPYMHDGRFDTLEQVIDHYSEGVQPHENVALAVPDRQPGQPFGFKYTVQQKKALVAFLKSLTDDRFTTDPRFSDPFQRPREN